MSWSTPSYVEITGGEAKVIRAGLREQAYRDRECWCCLAPLRDRTSTYCSHACREEIGDVGDVDLPARVVGLVIRLPRLSLPPAYTVPHHVAA